LGHSWFDYDDDGEVPMDGTPLALRCDRCGTGRRDIIEDGTGELLRRSYDYPPGYRYGSGERPTRNDFRVGLIAMQRQQRRKR
jgi:hypothetical protein